MAARSSEVRPVFVCGLVRSGTTWLSRTLGQSDELHYIGEAWLLDRLHEVVTWYQTIHRSWGPFTVWKRAGIGPDRAIAAIAACYERLLLEASAGRRFVEKTPGWNLLQLEFLTRLFPHAYYVLVYRDGRNQVASMEAHHRAIGVDFDFVDATRGWVQGMEVIGRYLDPPAGIAAMVVRYEDMVQDFEHVFAEVGRIVDIAPFQPSPHPPNSRFPDAVGRGEFNRRWQDWSADRIATFERHAGHQLRAWSYVAA